MHNIKEIRKDFSKFQKSLEKRNIEVDFEKPLNYVEPPPKPKPKPSNPKPPQNKGFVPFSGKGNKLGSS